MLSRKGDMEVAVELWYKEVSSDQQRIFVTFDPSKVKQCLHKLFWIITWEEGDEVTQIPNKIIKFYWLLKTKYTQPKRHNPAHK